MTIALACPGCGRTHLTQGPTEGGGGKSPLTVCGKDLRIRLLDRARWLWEVLCPDCGTTVLCTLRPDVRRRPARTSVRPPRGPGPRLRRGRTLERGRRPSGSERNTGDGTGDTR
jgi:hypothetical protein